MESCAIVLKKEHHQNTGQISPLLTHREKYPEAINSLKVILNTLISSV